MTSPSYRLLQRLLVCLPICACSADSAPITPSIVTTEPVPAKLDVPESPVAQPVARLIEHTFTLVTGVLSWRDTKLAPFSAESRKDEQLFNLLGALGVPRDQRRLLLDDQATQGGMMATARALLVRGCCVYP